MGHSENVLARSPTTAAAAARLGGQVGLRVAAAAERVGVAPSTLRAWERRYGIRPTSWTVGGHRRYGAEDLAALQRMRISIASGMSTASAAALHVSSIESRSTTADVGGRVVDDVLAGRFAEAVQSMAPAAVSRAAKQILRERGVQNAWSQVFVPYLQAVGQLWAQRGEAIDSEHIAVAALQATLRAHANRHAPGSRLPRVIAAAVPGEAHTLPLDALSAALGESGINTCVLYEVPAVVLHATVRRYPNAVVVLWARGGGGKLSALRDLAGQSTRMCAAGPGWRRSRLPASVSLLNSLPSAVTTLTAMTAAP